jgi:hypothetical protein
MGHRKCFSAVACMVFVGMMLLIMAATSAQAQQSACVFLKVGAGYQAEMRITSGSWQTSWSDKFDIGSTKCQPMSNLAPGAAYTVEVKAVLGETKSCSPQVPYNPTYQGSITYLASGSTLHVECTLPSGEKK